MYLGMHTKRLEEWSHHHVILTKTLLGLFFVLMAALIGWA
jgi:hypothetical protein